MCDRLLSVGLDVGTTTTQMIFSQITVQNRASGFAVPEMTITDRQVIYQSPVHFTPLKGIHLVDGEGIRKLTAQEYEKAGIDRSAVNTGAIIITGETSRKENAREVLQALSDYAGEFVVATAGPDLESILAAKGAGASEYSEKTGKTVLHMDIGGGTSNLALLKDGKVVYTGCLNVGGRLIKLDSGGTVTYVSPVLNNLTDIHIGDQPSLSQLCQVANMLCSALEMAAGRIPKTVLLETLLTHEVHTVWEVPTEPVTVSFSGGVADCIESEKPPLEFGDIGPLLGTAIRKSSLCQGDYVLGKQTIRATVIGAGCYSTQLSGSTVFCQGVELPKKNIPVISFSLQEQNGENFANLIANRLAMCGSEDGVLAIPGNDNPDYRQVSRLAEQILEGVGEKSIYVCLQTDMAKALGQRLSLLSSNRPCLCLDRLKFTPESYLDIGMPVGPCFPVVIKTLVLANAP